MNRWLTVCLIGCLCSTVCSCSSSTEESDPASQPAPSAPTTGPSVTQEPTSRPPRRLVPRMAVLEADVSDLKHTVITPHLAREIRPGQNVIWCASFQLAWNELVDFAGGKLEVQGPPLKMVEQLNRRIVTKDHLAEADVVAMAGMAGDDRVAEIRRRIKTKFGDRARPRLLDMLEGLGPNDVFMYAYLLKELPFEHPFDDLDDIAFYSSKEKEDQEDSWKTAPQVRCFGLKSYFRGDALAAKQAEQVRIIWHKFKLGNRGGYVLPTNQQFIVELKTTSTEDRLILAKIEPAKTLAATVAFVQQRLAKPNALVSKDGRYDVYGRLDGGSGPPEDPLSLEAEAYLKRSVALYEKVSQYAHLLDEEDLKVPVLSFDLTEDFAALAGRSAICPNPKVNGMPFAMASQRVHFQLSRYGAALESEGGGSLFGGGSARDFIFDGPFLVMLIRKGASQPYLAIWVGHEEILTPAPPKPGPDGPATRAIEEQ